MIAANRAGDRAVARDAWRAETELDDRDEPN